MDHSCSGFIVAAVLPFQWKILCVGVDQHFPLLAERDYFVSLVLLLVLNAAL